MICVLPAQPIAKQSKCRCITGIAPPNINYPDAHNVCSSSPNYGSTYMDLVHGIWFRRYSSGGGWPDIDLLQGNEVDLDELKKMSTDYGLTKELTTKGRTR